MVIPAGPQCCRLKCGDRPRSTDAAPTFRSWYGCRGGHAYQSARIVEVIQLVVLLCDRCRSELAVVPERAVAAEQLAVVRAHVVDGLCARE